MQSTKGRAEHFVWLCRIDALGNRYAIQPFAYIEGSRFQTKRAAFRHAETARMRWQDNYAPYRDATMILVDSAEIEPTSDFFNPMTKAGKPNKPLAALRRVVSGSDKPAIVEVATETASYGPKITLSKPIRVF